MNNLNHTPAPWQYLSNDREREYKFFVYNAAYSRWAIAENMRETDARLIAAAPEMLEALIKQYISFCAPCKKCNPQHENCYSCESQEELQKLIEKATGLTIEEVLK